MKAVNYLVGVPVLAICTLLSLAACSKSSAVVGKWQDDNSARQLDFEEDGTVVMTTPNGEIRTVPGKWSVQSDGRILLQFNSMFGGVGLYAHLEGNELVLDDNRPRYMHRVD